MTQGISALRRLSLPAATGQAVPIPRTALGVLAYGVLALIFAQAALGCDPIVLVFAVLSIVVGFVPMAIIGIDLYTLMIALIVVRYVGFAAIAKTLYLAPLDSHLFIPEESYGLTLLLMLTFTGLTLVARAFDGGKSWFAAPADVVRLRRAGLMAFILGAVAAVVVGVIRSRYTAIGNGGALYVISDTVRCVFFFAVIAEIFYTAKTRPAGTFITRRLVFFLVAAMSLSVVLNSREFFVDSIITTFVTTLLLGKIKLRHLIFGAAFVGLGATFLSPLVLVLRTAREGQSFQEYAANSFTIIQEVIEQPNYLRDASEHMRLADKANFRAVAYDYYGDYSNILNRFSYVALLDRVDYGTKTHAPIGFGGFEQEVIPRTVPSFLVKDKGIRPYQYSDWLSWQMGMAPADVAYATNFGLPMEGLASFGVAGLLFYPVLFYLPMLFLCARISSLKRATPLSIMIWCAVSWPIVEGASDAYLSFPIRTLPLIVLAMLVIFWAAELAVLAQIGGVAIQKSRV